MRSINKNTKSINKNTKIKSSYYQYEHWQAKQLREMPDCYTGSGAEGKELFQSILETCAREYPEDIETFAERFNTEKCFPSILSKIKRVKKEKEVVYPG